MVLDHLNRFHTLCIVDMNGSISENRNYLVLRLEEEYLHDLLSFDNHMICDLLGCRIN